MATYFDKKRQSQQSERDRCQYVLDLETEHVYLECLSESQNEIQGELTGENPQLQGDSDNQSQFSSDIIVRQEQGQLSQQAQNQNEQGSITGAQKQIFESERKNQEYRPEEYPQRQAAWSKKTEQDKKSKTPKG